MGALITSKVPTCRRVLSVAFAQKGGDHWVSPHEIAKTFASSKGKIERGRLVLMTERYNISRHCNFKKKPAVPSWALVVHIILVIVEPYKALNIKQPYLHDIYQSFFLSAKIFISLYGTIYLCPFATHAHDTLTLHILCGNMLTTASSSTPPKSEMQFTPLHLESRVF